MKKLKVLLAVLCIVFVACAVMACSVKDSGSAKTVVNAPVINSKVYNGEKQAATVEASDAYTVIENNGGVNAGEYNVVLKLTDENAYEWKTPDEADTTMLTLTFSITKAANEITVLTVADRTYGEQAAEPTAMAKFGTPEFTYATSENGEYTATVPSAVGKYWVKATVEGTSNYDGAIKTAQFEIKKAASAVTTAPAAKTELVYNRNAQELVTAGVTSDGTLKYKLGENGTWSETIPTATDAGDYKVYYKVVGDESHSDTAETEISVTIAKADAAFTAAPQDPDLSYKGEAQALVTAGVTDDGTVEYKLGDGEWSETIPTGINATTYKIYYRIIGDKNHNDLAGDTLYIAVTIARVNSTYTTAPTAAKNLVYTGADLTLAVAGEVVGGELRYSLDNEKWSANLPTAKNAGEYTVYYKIEPDANHTGATNGSFKVVIAKAANEVTFSLDGEEIHCGDAVPTEFNATSVAGAITYAYSIDNVNFYPINGLGEDFKFEAGKTYYVKATAAESENYLSAYKVASIVATHKFGEGVENDGIVTATCACGHKQVTGERTTNSTVDFAATVGEDGTVSATAGELDISAVYSESAEGVKLTVNETEYNAAVVNGKITLKGVIPVTVYGNVKLGIKFTTENGEYDFTAPALIVSKKITDLDSFRAISAIERLINGGGYYMFANDVVLSGQDRFIRYYNNTVDYTIGAGNGQNGSKVDRPFVGTIDGNGYSLYNLGMTGWFGKAGFINNLGATGVLKNLGFIDVTLHGQASIVANGSGLIENVYVKYKIYGSNTTGTEFVKGQIVSQPQTVTFGTYGLAANASFTMRNIVVDFTSVCEDLSTIATTELHASQYLLGAYSSKATFTNVVVLNVPKFDGHIVNADNETKVYVKYNDATDNGVELPATNWDKELWTANDGSLPAFNGMTANKDKGFTKSTSVIEVGASAEFIVPINCLMYIDGELPEGITFENGVITVDESVAVGTTFTICSKNIFDTANVVEVEVRIAPVAQKSTLETAVTVDLNASIESGVITVNGAENSVDISSIFNGECANPVVTLDGVTISGATVDGGTLKFNSSAVPATVYGTKSLVVRIETTDAIYEITMTNVLVATKVIRTADDLNAIRVKQENIDNNTSIFGYYVLANDISLGWRTLPETSLTYTKEVQPYEANFGFRGTFDGLGHTISRFAVTKNGLFGHVGKGAVIKNVNFDKLTYNKAYYATLFGFTVRGAEISNVNITLAGYNGLDTDKHCQGFIAARYMQDNKLTKIKIDASAFDVYSVFGHVVTNNTCSGVEVKVKSYTTLGYIADKVIDANMVKAIDGVTVTTATTEA